MKKFRLRRSDVFLLVMIIGGLILHGLLIKVSFSSGKPPMFLVDHYNSLSPQNQERTFQIKIVEENETNLLISGAAVIAGIVLANFVFGPHLLTSMAEFFMLRAHL